MSLKQWFTKVLCKQPSISLCFIAATLATLAANDVDWRVTA